MIALQTYEQVVAEYVDSVLSGRRVVGSLVRDAVQRHVEDLERSETDEFRYVFNTARAEEACQFFPNCLEHTTGEYDMEPFVLYPFQAFIVWSIFGWRRKDNGYRRFRRAFVTMGRGGGKSPLAAGIMIYLFSFDNPIEARAECYTVATKVKQANIIFNECQRFVSRNPKLRSLITSRKYNLSINANGSKLEPLASESKSADGLLPHAICADELHEWRDEHIGLFDKLETAMHKRRQPLWLFTTTAGTEESHIWLEEYNLCRSVVDRKSNVEADHIFAYIAEIDDEDNPLDPDVWVKATPIIEHGVLDISSIQAAAYTAATSPAKLNQFKRYHCNKIVESVSKSISSEMWARGNGEMPDLDGIVPFAGVDLGLKNDMAAVGWCFELEPEDENRRFALEVDVFVPQGTALPLHRQPYLSWVNDGLIIVTQRETTDMQAIYKMFEERLERHGCQEIGCDPWSAFEFCQNMDDKFGIMPEPFKQNCASYSEPLRVFKASLAESRLYHGGNPVLEWAARNMTEREDTNGHAMPAKRNSPGKIDPIVAVIMAFGRCLLSEPEVDSYAETGNML